MSANTRVFVARLTGLSVFDPLGDQVGRVRDVVVMFSVNRPSRASSASSSRCPAADASSCP